MEDFEEKAKISKYNEGLNQVLRLNILWDDCNNFARSGNLIKWKWTLDAVWRELSPAAKVRDKNKKDEEKATLTKDKHNLSIANSKTQDELYIALNNKEEFLRLLQDEVGKGTVWTEADEDEFD